jgi:6-phosphogluconolactonase/glucosamine-6-phosphate isomerase/deaminase
MWVFNVDRASAFSCDTDDELFKVIMDKENSKLLDNHPEYGQTSWSFTIYSVQRVRALYLSTSRQRHSDALKEAFARSLPLIEICTGDFINPLEIVADERADVKRLKKQWCLDYCRVHNYDVIENTKEQVHHVSTLPTQPPSAIAN